MLSTAAAPVLGLLPGSPTPQPTHTPTQTASAQEAPSSLPTPTLPASPTPAPLLRQLTSGGCCTGPGWSPDGQRVLVIDRPAPDAPAGLWEISLAGGDPQLLTERLGLFSPDLSLVAFPENGQTIIQRLADGTRWTLPSEGQAVSFSPDSAWVAWTVGQAGQSFDPTPREVWVSRVDGTQAQAVFQIYGGGFAGWFPDGRILVNGRQSPEEEQQGLWAVTLESGETLELARVSRTRGILISPGGDWLAFTVVFDPDPAQNGLWLVNARSAERFRLDRFGAFRWRDAHRLLVIPLDLTQAQHRFWEYDTRRPSESRSQAVPLTDPAITPLRIAHGDWSVSPDGRRIVFVSADDHNLWVIELPGE